MRVRGTDSAKEKLKHVSTCDLVQELALQNRESPTT
ncbi:unknown [Firmicutes bacterium CAG:238]|nr:unknown [Firmicutes bacterium CAG:238]